MAHREYLWRAPRWCAPVGSVLCLAGLGVSAYLTYEHFTGSTSLSCPATGSVINCLEVTTSVYSRINGIPVAVLGLIFFAVMTILQSPPSWRSTLRPLFVARMVWALVGVGTALWLVWAELFRIDAICLWCTSVHVISLILFAVTVVGTASALEAPATEESQHEPTTEVSEQVG